MVDFYFLLFMLLFFANPYLLGSDNFTSFSESVSFLSQKALADWGAASHYLAPWTMGDSRLVHGAYRFGDYILSYE